MGKVILDITMSLDGFVAAPNVGLEHPLGEGGLRLHDWLFRGTSTPGPDRFVADELFAMTGAFVLGRRTFDVGEGRWGDDGAFGRPCFVLTHRGRATLIKGPTTFTFVLDGIASALRQARAAAGEKAVCVMGGAQVARQYLDAGLVDELRLHIVSILLGSGTRLFEHIAASRIALSTTRVTQSPFATHLDLRVAR